MQLTPFLFFFFLLLALLKIEVLQHPRPALCPDMYATQEFSCLRITFLYSFSVSFHAVQVFAEDTFLRRTVQNASHHKHNSVQYKEVTIQEHKKGYDKRFEI